MVSKKNTRLQQFIAVYSRWLTVEDHDYFEVVFGCCFANIHLNSKPVWLYAVGTSGSGKSELLQSLDGHPKIELLSSLTEKTLISGLVLSGDEDSNDASFLPKLNGKILILKDFTTLMKERREVLANLMGQLRDMYDGKSRRAFGTGKSTMYVSKFGIIAGVTFEIDKHITTLAALGERFLIYRLPILTRDQKKARALTASRNLNVTRQEEKIQKAAHYVLDLTPIKPEIPEEIMLKLETLAEFVAKARTHVERDRYNREVVYDPEPEVHTRLLKQLSDLARGICMAREKACAGLSELRLIRKIGFDCIPSNRAKLLRLLALRFPDKISNQEAADACKLSRSAVYYWLDDLHKLDLVKKITIAGGSGHGWSRYTWVLRKHYGQLLRRILGLKRKRSR